MDIKYIIEIEFLNVNNVISNQIILINFKLLKMYLIMINLSEHRIIHNVY